MSPPSPLWNDIIGPFRASAWQDCIRLARAVVDADTDDLAARFLLGRLYLCSGDPHLAQLQYERLLPLAVGQGDLMLALAAQKHLDALHPEPARHARRYAAMHQWFHSLGRGRRKRRKRAADTAPGITPADLIGLSADRFDEIAEGARIEFLGLEPLDVEAGGGVLWVVLSGRVRGFFERESPGEMTERDLKAGESLACAAGLEDVVRVRLIPETPTECLVLDPALLAEIAPPAPEASATPAQAPPPEQAELAEAPPPEQAAPEEAPLPESPPEVEAPPAETEARPVTPEPAPPAGARRPASPRPMPDPVAEPMIAMGAPLERRQDTRIAISLEDRSALLGFAGTRVAPIRGVLHNLSAAGLYVGFAREELMPLRRALDNAVVRVQLTLGGRTVLHLGVRVTWVEDAKISSREGSGVSDAVLSLEFLSVSEGDLTRIDQALTQPADPRRRHVA